MPDHTLDRVLDQTAAAAELQQLLLDTDDILGFLDEVADYAASIIGAAATNGCNGPAATAPLGAAVSCGITLGYGGGRALTVASNDTRARNMDEVQYGHDNAPCLTTMRTGTTVAILDLATNTSWGTYRLDALAHGIGSALSIPLSGGEDLAGALTLYSAAPGAFGATRHTLAEGVPVEVLRALGLAVRLSNQNQLSAQLEEAMASRATIDRALGIIMGQNRCPARAAFDILRAASSHLNIKLRDVAADIVTRVSGEPPDPPTDPRTPNQ